MKWNDPQFIEAIRLIRKFFPECKGYIEEENPLSIEVITLAMRVVGCKTDFSEDPFSVNGDPNLGFREAGGFEGTDDEIYNRILKHTGISPIGRVVIVPDAVTQSIENNLPFVCHSDSAPSRLSEIDNVFNNNNDSLFVYESGEVFAVNHDNRLFWAKSNAKI